jgi:hypothetical protein
MSNVGADAFVKSEVTVTIATSHYSSSSSSSGSTGSSPPFAAAASATSTGGGGGGCRYRTYTIYYYYYYCYYLLYNHHNCRNATKGQRDQATVYALEANANMLNFVAPLSRPAKYRLILRAGILYRNDDEQINGTLLVFVNCWCGAKRNNLGAAF